MSQRMTKPTKWHVRPAKTQISLGIRPVCSESSLSAWWKLESLATHWVQSENFDQTGRMPRLIWVFAGRTCYFVGFVVRWLKCDINDIRLQDVDLTLPWWWTLILLLSNTTTKAQKILNLLRRRLYCCNEEAVKCLNITCPARCWIHVYCFWTLISNNLFWQLKKINEGVLVFFQRKITPTETEELHWPPLENRRRIKTLLFTEPPTTSHQL